MVRVLVILVLVTCILKETNSELRFVFEMFRHGARGPWTGVDSNNNDIFGEHWSSAGELTGVGMRQHYLLGHRNRVRYQDFISSSYSVNEIYVVSTDYNRTIMSAYSQLQGMYPNGTGPILTQTQISVAFPPTNNTDFLPEQEKLASNALPNQMQVLPIHIFDMDAHKTSLFDTKNCPGVVPYYKKNKQASIFQDALNNFNATWGEKLSHALNITNDSNFFLQYDNVYSICDTFISDYTEGKTLTNLRNAGIDLEDFNKTAYDFMFFDIFNVEFSDEKSIVAKVAMSPIGNDVVSWMDKRVDYDGKNISYLGYGSNKLVMYSAHDTTMAAMEVYLKSIFNKTELYYTPFASSIFFELYRREKTDNSTTYVPEDYYVTVIYNDIYILNMTYTDFSTKIKQDSFSQDYINDFCGFTVNSNSTDPYFISTICLSVLSFGLLAYVVYSCYKNKKESPGGAYNNI
jgi:acid phosphatase